MPKTVEDEAWWTLWVEDEGDIRHGVSAAKRPSPTTGVGVVDRAVDVLDAVEGGARSFTAIAEATGLTKPTAHRMITALQAHGFLMHVGGVGYALGPRLLDLATTAMRELPLRQLARPALEQLARTTGESAQLYVRHGDHRICVDAVESDNELRTFVPIGASLPLGRGSAGKVFLAWGPPSDEDVEDIRQSIATTRRRVRQRAHLRAERSSARSHLGLGTARSPRSPAGQALRPGGRRGGEAGRAAARTGLEAHHA